MLEPSPEAWAQIRHDYEQTDRPVVEICLQHGFTANTLRHRARRWGWRLRRARIPDEGPPPAMAPPVEAAKTESWALGPRFRGDERGESVTSPDAEPSPHLEIADTRPIVERLQGAVGRVLPAIETTLARLAAGPMRPREMELAARALGSLMRTLRELNGLLGQHATTAAGGDPPPENMDEFRNALARRIEAVIERHEAEIPARYEAAWNEYAAEAKQ